MFDELNFPGLPITWVNSSVEDTYETISFLNKIPTTKYLSTGKLAVIDQSANFIGGYIDDPELAVTKDLPVIVFGDHTRVLKFIDFPFAAGADGIKVFKPKEFFYPKLYYFFLQAIKLPNKGYARHFQYLRSSKIPIPPLNEQKRIANKLDRLIARVNACREHLEQVTELIKRFRESVLDEAISGRLTEKWRKTQNGNHSWKKIDLQDVADVIDPHPSHRTPKEYSGGIPYIGIGDVKEDGSFDFENARKISPEVFKEHKQRYQIDDGDFVFGKIGTLGKATPLPVGIDYTLSANVILIQPKKSLTEPKYIMCYLQTPSIINDIFEQSNSTSQVAFGIKKMRSLEILLPLLVEQKEIVRRVDKLFAHADRLESRYQVARKLVDDLTPALLAKAFRGELVPQDPNDEPASVLLERIRKDRKAISETISQHPKKEKTKKTPKSEGLMRNLSEIKPTHLSDILRQHKQMLPEKLWIASELNIDDFYDQLKNEEAKGYLREIRASYGDMVRVIGIGPSNEN